jgi:arylsulfatase A-like enzyme/Flp pilus assembly protein TadD
VIQRFLSATWSIRRELIGGIFAVGVLAALACWVGYKPRTNVLLITLDTTRADHLGCYGYANCQTPVIDELAATGTFCEQAYSVAPLTLPAHASLLTGLYPAETGLVTNGRGRLPDSIDTLGEALHRQGYDTAAFVASFVLDAKFGLDQGFARYDDDLSGDEASFTGAHRRRTGKAVVDRALAWLSGMHSRPFFCWVHLYDPHMPYQNHADLFGEQFSERPYDAEIAYVDGQVGRLVDFLKARGLEKNTLVVVTADHGEGLGEHLEGTHGSTLYNSVMRVPLIFHQPGHVPAGRRVSANVSLVDVFPTVLELLGLDFLPRVSGNSLVRAIRGQDMPSSACYAATDEPFLRNGWAPLRSVLDGKWKYIQTSRPELYNLADDPRELQNLIDAAPEQSLAMRALLASVEARFDRRETVGVQLTASERRKLESLGYVIGNNTVKDGSQAENLPDIKDMLQFDNAVEEAIRLKGQGQMDSAVRLLRDVMVRAPSHTYAYLYLGDILAARSEFDEAANVYRALLEIKPDAAGAHFGLAYILLAQGRRDEAIAEYTREIAINPDGVEAHCNLAKVLGSAGDVETALAHFETACDIDPWNAAPFRGRAGLLAQLGRTLEAIDDYRQSLKLAPDDTATHRELGLLLSQQGQLDDARRHLTRAVELEPSSPEGHFLLGSFLLRQREYAAAVEHLSRAVELQPGFAEAEKCLDEARSGLRLSN